MAKIDLDSLSIEELAALRDNAIDKLAQKVTARQAELEAELEKLSLYGKPAKKPLAAPVVAKARKSDEAARKGDEAKETTAKAA
jgi:chromosomal replication initiation ATPase DnaA